MPIYVISLVKKENILHAEPESVWIEFLSDTMKKANQINHMKRQFQSLRHIIVKYFKNKIGKEQCKSPRQGKKSWQILGNLGKCQHFSRAHI